MTSVLEVFSGDRFAANSLKPMIAVYSKAKTRIALAHEATHRRSSEHLRKQERGYMAISHPAAYSMLYQDSGVMWSSCRRTYAVWEAANPRTIIVACDRSTAKDWSQ